MSVALNESVKLNDGTRMPLLGLGCWQSSEDEVKQAVESALDCGYRHVDTAALYLNEAGVGDGITTWLKKSGVPRKELYVVTKLPMTGMYEAGVEKHLKSSLKKLQLEYVDLYLIHLPIGLKETSDPNVMLPRKPDGTLDLDYSTDLIAIWKEMEKMVDAGLAKSIGVSNFNIKQIKKLCAISRIKPAVNQIEMHVCFQQKEMQQYCKEEDIILTAYGPLGSPGRANRPNLNTQAIPSLLTNPVVILIANNHQVSTAQILVKFWIQQGVVCIPKSVTPSRIKSNGQVFGFKLSDVEMDALKYIDRGEEGRSFDFFNNNGYENHPECPVPRL